MRALLPFEDWDAVGASQSPAEPLMQGPEGDSEELHLELCALATDLLICFSCQNEPRLKLGFLLLSPSSGFGCI